VSQSTLARAVEDAHRALWDRFIHTNGLIHDYEGEIPSPEDCALGRPNAIGWWSPIENGPMFTGLYLPAACERAARSGDPTDVAQVRELVQGLLLCASVSDVPGFIVRGTGADGTCHYPLGSDDQTHPWFCGLHAYLISGIPTEEEREQVVGKMVAVADVLEATGWRCPCDGVFKGEFRGTFRGHWFRDAVRYLHLFKIMHEITGDAVWLDRYLVALAEKPETCTVTRIELAAQGYVPDRAEIQHIDVQALWIYVGCQIALARLIDFESNESRRALYRAGLAINAENASLVIDAYKVFDNDDTQVFGHANWREGYPAWFPQTTQEQAKELACKGDKTKLGTRKHYECRHVRNPLAAAAIMALAGDSAKQEAIERVICHYDYAKLHMAEFFFAECAHYAIPPKQ
jgi:hypothetical protein